MDLSDTVHGNVALLIDADNASPAGLEAALTILAELGSVNIRRAYGNWAKPSLKGWASLIQRHAIEPQQQFDITKGKNATDMKMTIDAMDLLHTRRIDGFGIMSSDSDFMPVAMRIRQNGIPVYGFGSEKAPEGFRQACSRFIDLDAWGQNQADEPEALSSDVGPELVELLGEAWKASKRDERGYAILSEVGQRFTARSSIDVRSYGFPRLSDLIRTLPQFEIETRENGRLYIKRLR